MRQNCGCHLSNSNEVWDEKKNKKSKVKTNSKEIKQTECRCFSPFVKIHHFDCPLVKKQCCPVHGDNHRCGDGNSCTILMFHPNFKNGDLLWPVETILPEKICCNANASNEAEHLAKNEKVQKSSVDFEKLKHCMDNDCCDKMTEILPTGNRSFEKKSQKRFINSSRDSFEHSSISERSDTQHKKSMSFFQAVDVSKIKKSDSKQSVNWYCIIPGRDELSENKIFDILRDKETENDILNQDTFKFNLLDQRINCNKKLSHLNSYFLYPTTVTEIVDPPLQKTSAQKLTSVDQEKHSDFEPKELFTSDERVTSNNSDLKEEIFDNFEYDSDVSNSSDSLFFIPYILEPRYFSKSQMKDTATEIGSSLMTITSSKKLCEVEDKHSFSEIKKKNSDKIDYENSSESEDSFNEKQTPIKKNEAFNVIKPANENLESKVQIFHRTTVQVDQNQPRNGESKTIRSVKGQNQNYNCVDFLPAKQIKAENVKIADDEKPIKKQGSPSNKKNESLNFSEAASNKPSTSFKLIQTTVSIMASMPQPGCHCETMLRQDQSEALNSIGSSNDTYDVIKSNDESKEKKILKFLNKSNSDSNVFNKTNSDAAEKDEKCFCKNVCGHSLSSYDESLKSKKKPQSPRDLQSSFSGNLTPSSALKPDPTASKNVVENTPLSDLSELIRIIDEGFDRMTHEMKEICECKDNRWRKKEVLVEREVMTENVYFDETTPGLNIPKKEIHFQKNAAPIPGESPENCSNLNNSHKINIRQSVPLNEPLNPTDVLVCKLCARNIKTYSKNAGTNTEGPQNKKGNFESFELLGKATVTKTVKREVSPSKVSPNKKPQLSSIPIPQKHNCIDIHTTVPSRPQTYSGASNQPHISPPLHNLPIFSTSPPQQSADYKSKSPTSKSDSPRERRRQSGNYITYKIQAPNIQPGTSKSPTQKEQPAKRTSPSITPGQRPTAKTQSNQNPSPLSQKLDEMKNPKNQSQNKFSGNFKAFPVRVPALRLNEYIRSLREEAMKRCKMNSPLDFGENYRCPLDNSKKKYFIKKTDDLDEELHTKECCLRLRPTKSDSRSCNRGTRTGSGSLLFSPKKEKDLRTFKSLRCSCSQSNLYDITSGSEKRYFCGEVIKSGAVLDREFLPHEANGSSQIYHKDEFLSEKTAPENPENVELAKNEKFYFYELVDPADPERSKNHSMDFKDRILARNSTLSNFPFSNDYEFFPEEYSDGESSTSQTDEPNGKQIN